MHPRYAYDLGKKIYTEPNVILLVKTDEGYVTFDKDLEVIKKKIGISPVPETMLADVTRVLKKNGYQVIHADNQLAPATAPAPSVASIT